MAGPSEPARRPLAVITGASSGIGAAFARRLAQKHYDLVLVARRKDRLEALASNLHNSFGIRAEWLEADLSKDEDLRRVEDRIEQEPALEALINNAGFGTLPLFHEASVESQDCMHRLHILATMRLAHAALPGLIARNKGLIINVSSVAAFIHGPGSISYGATKAWINSFTEGLHLELQFLGSKVKVQALCPGYTYSEFHEVLGLNRRFVGKRWWMPAEKVVDESLAAAERGKLYVIPGFRYKAVVFLVKLLPRAFVRALAMRGSASRLNQTSAGKRS